jgi:hypothetical protein
MQVSRAASIWLEYHRSHSRENTLKSYQANQICPPLRFFQLHKEQSGLGFPESVRYPGNEADLPNLLQGGQGDREKGRECGWGEAQAP